MTPSEIAALIATHSYSPQVTYIGNNVYRVVQVAGDGFKADNLLTITPGGELGKIVYLEYVMDGVPTELVALNESAACNGDETIMLDSDDGRIFFDAVFG